MTSEYTIVKYPGLEDVDTTRDNNSNNFIDLTSEAIEFLDKSALHVTGSKIIFSLEEAETHYNLSNFELEIYEIDETPKSDTSGRESGPDLKRLKNINHINSLFHIKTDEHVTQVKTPFGVRRNWYRSGEWVMLYNRQALPLIKTKKINVFKNNKFSYGIDLSLSRISKFTQSEYKEKASRLDKR